VRHPDRHPSLVPSVAMRLTPLRLLALATLLRLAVAAWLPLGIDESYAVVVSRTLTLSYFDHPPAVFWLTYLATTLGGESAIAVRWPFVALFAATCWMLFRLTARLFGERAGFWALCSAQLIPVFSLSSGSWALPDGPLLAASVAAALALTHAIPLRGVEGEPLRTHVGWAPWIALGLALGAAGLSKYHAVLLGLGIAGFLVTDVEARQWLRRPQPWVALLIAVVCAAPVLLWNAQHDWVSFRFQGTRASGGGGAITALLQNLAGQAGYVLPWFWAPLILLLFRALRTGPRDRFTWYCCCLGALPVLLFTMVSLGGRPGLPHWPAPGFFMLLPLLGAAIARWEQRSPTRAIARMRGAAAVFVLLVSLVASHAATGWLAAFVPSLRRRDPAFELLEYRTLRDTLTGMRLLPRASYVATTDWLRGAKVGYALGPIVPILVLNDDARHFAFSVDASPLIGRNGVLLVKRDASLSEAEMWHTTEPYLTMFDTIRYVRTVPVLRGADTALSVGVFETINLRQAYRRSTVR
jgi:4-amino-4-deoxy-L-arabinose transferase-like glycosyltransferase